MAGEPVKCEKLDFSLASEHRTRYRPQCLGGIVGMGWATRPMPPTLNSASAGFWHLSSTPAVQSLACLLVSRQQTSTGWMEGPG